MVKNGLGHSNDQNLELAAFQEGIDVINLFFASSYNFREAESWLNSFWVAVVKGL